MSWPHTIHGDRVVTGCLGGSEFRTVDGLLGSDLNFLFAVNRPELGGKREENRSE
jgi:hypothetical protein